MPTLCRAYMTDAAAHAAVDRLLATGMAVDDIRVLMGEPARDGRDARAGSFAGVAAPAGIAEPVGSFAGAPGASREAMGEFASSPAPARRGSFGDLDRE